MKIVASVTIEEEKNPAEELLSACEKIRKFGMPRTREEIQCIAKATEVLNRLTWILGFNQAGVANYEAVQRICCKIRNKS